MVFMGNGMPQILSAGRWFNLSIYPKRVVFGENVIVHIRFRTDSSKPRVYSCTTYVVSPKKEIIQTWNRQFIMPGGTKETQKEFYYCINGRKLIEPGLYRVVSDLIVEGKMVHSDTYANDFFTVDRLTVNRLQDRNRIVITNESGTSNCPIYLTYKDGKEMNLELSSGESKEVDLSDVDFIKYADGVVLTLNRKEKKYLRKSIDWRIENNCIVARDKKYHEISLSNALSFVFLNCDGKKDVAEITKLMNVPRTIVEEMINYLIKIDLLEKVNIC